MKASHWRRRFPRPTRLAPQCPYRQARFGTESINKGGVSVSAPSNWHLLFNQSIHVRIEPPLHHEKHLVRALLLLVDMLRVCQAGSISNAGFGYHAWPPAPASGRSQPRASRACLPTHARACTCLLHLLKKRHRTHVLSNKKIHDGLREGRTWLCAGLTSREDPLQGPATKGTNGATDSQ